MTELWCLRWTRPLTDTEKERLAALLPPRRRERKADEEALCAYGLLRFALGEKALPAIALGERGKPYFPDRPDLHFSLSHTEGAALVGLSSAPIGVDIEKVRPLGPRVRGKLGANLSDEEAFRRWTALEARSKRSGEGVAAFLHRDTWEESGDCVSLDVGEGYAASAACREAPRLRHCTLEDILK